MAAAEAKSAAQDRARANAAAAAAAAASADELNDSDDDNDFMTGFGAIEDVNTEYEYAMAEAGGRWKTPRVLRNHSKSARETSGRGACSVICGQHPFSIVRIFLLGDGERTVPFFLQYYIC